MRQKTVRVADRRLVVSAGTSTPLIEILDKVTWPPHLRHMWTVRGWFNMKPYQLREFGKACIQIADEMAMKESKDAEGD